MDRKGSSRLSRKDNLTRECRNFYERRLRTMEKMKQSPDWCIISSESTSCCSSAITTPTSTSDECSAESDSCCNSTLELNRTESNTSTPSRFEKAVTHLRREIATLISQDNDLFRQLLALNDSIEELKEQRQGILCDSSYDDEEEDDEEISRTGSFDSLCESELAETNQTSSPTSTLSSTSSTDVRPIMILPKNFIRNGVSIPPSKTNKRTNSTANINSRTVPVIRCDVIRPSSLLFKNQTIPTTKATTNGQPVSNAYRMNSRSGYLPSGFRPLHTSQGSFDSGFNGSYSESEVEIFV